MKIVEFYSGTQSISSMFREKGHTTLCIENNPIFTEAPYHLEQLTISVADVSVDTILQLIGKPDVVWASPVCATHSVAAIGKHRVKIGEYLYPKSDKAREHDLLLEHTIDLINQLQPTYWFIENPRGGMRKSPLMLKLNGKRHTVTYCQYGDSRMKPTDIWTNHPNPNFKPMCKNGDPCHESAPRGSRTGTQGLNGDIDRSVIPKELCKHIVDICEKGGSVDESTGSM